ncbi:alpha/beta hydrolase [Rhodoferax sp. GW822-FHT02A01]|uniref:alpha/beta fold hydrolase n=1 Tax=Rhodoferax sp. GW822-FHT02A01 TaxID=3141537 RepID=UPI00315D3EAA
MADPTLNFIHCPDATGGHRMAFWQWGDPQAAHTVLCVHGLTRQGRDFDVLVQSLIARSPHPLRVICPDVAGRGMSEWLSDPQAYAIHVYAGDMLALLAQLKPQTLDWVGTSMGGLIGIGVSAHAHTVGTTVRRLVLNDVGPALEWESLLRIGNYLGKNMHFDTLEHAADHLWGISTGFGPHTRQQWLALSAPMVKPDPQGGVRLHYDPAIAVPFLALTQEVAQQGEAALWQLYDSLTAQTLLVRGAESDLLSAQTAHQMTQRGPRARLLEFAGVGHAPTFVTDEQVGAVCSFLLD